MSTRDAITNHIARIGEVWSENTAELATYPEAEVEEAIKDIESLNSNGYDVRYTDLLREAVKRAREEQAEWEKEDEDG